jgi:hypothetical protein
MAKTERITIPVRDLTGAMRDPLEVDGIRVGPFVCRPVLSHGSDGTKTPVIGKGGVPTWTVSSPTGFCAGNFRGQRRAIAAAKALLAVDSCNWEATDPTKTFPSMEAKRAAFDAIRDLRL